MGFPKQILCLFLVLILSRQIDGNRPKRMYALCPPHFIGIGNECYFISQKRVNWLDAHFECLHRNSQLAEPFDREDRFLRKYLNHYPGSKPAEIWIGALFNWERNKWQWGHNGKDVTYQSFSQMSADNKDLKFHCAILKPNLKFRWSASSCEQQHQYISQHRMPYVNEKNRQKVYNKWNETYPNEMANEIEVVLSDDDLLRNRRRKMHRSHMRNVKNRQIKGEPNHRQRNHIHNNHFQQFNPMPNQNRRMRPDGNRSRNQAYHRKFELTGKRGNGVRQHIQFNNTNDPNNRQFIENRIWRQRTSVPIVWSNTNAPGIPPTTVPTWSYTTTMRSTHSPTVSPTMPIVISNDVTQVDDAQYQRQREEFERQQYEEKMRRKQEIIEQERRMEQERQRNEERQRAHHQMELDRRRQEMINEQQRIQEEKNRQDLERREQNEMNRRRYEEEQKRQAELERQRNDQTQQRVIQTNEILEENSATTMSPRKQKLKKLHDRLSKLSPEEIEMFYKKRAERNKKRGANHE